MNRYFLVAVVLGTVLCSGCFRHPSDEVFRSIFSKNRAAFLQASADTEASGFIGYITPGQQATILKMHPVSAPLLHEDFNLARREDGTVLFGFSAFGLAIAGSRKGIAHIPPRSLKLYTVLPLAAPWPRAEGDFAKPLEGEWYIFVIN